MESPFEQSPAQTFSTDENDVLRCAAIYEELGGIKNIWELQDALSKFSCTFTDTNSAEVKKVFQRVGYHGGELTLPSFIDLVHSVKGILSKPGLCIEPPEDEGLSAHTAEEITSICASFGLLSPSRRQFCPHSGFYPPTPGGRSRNSGRLTPLVDANMSMLSSKGVKNAPNQNQADEDLPLEFTYSEEGSDYSSEESSAATPEATWLGTSTHSRRSDYISAVRAASILVKSDPSPSATPKEKLCCALDKMALKKMFHSKQYHSLITNPGRHCVWGSPKSGKTTQRKRRKPDIPARGSPMAIVRRELNDTTPYALSGHSQGRNADTSTKLADMSYAPDINDATILARHLKNAHISRVLGRRVPLQWPPTGCVKEPKKPSEEKKKDSSDPREGKKKKRRRKKAAPTSPTLEVSMEEVVVPLDVTPPRSPPEKAVSPQLSRQMQKWLSSEGTANPSNQLRPDVPRPRRIIPRTNLWAP
eukprot:TRINITY_DN5627_c3_g1_i1.p1 TRINITY_DN5627_c3_g1~~TRINITY_DN5627_c3_g1_i1.p1  ORF type:complete len:475 (+),score=75.85 TRINITY_DN5627_c3_g1_i1:176-1600(+)